MSKFPNEKLLSHRLRGYPGGEHGLASFQAVGDYPVPYIEIDTRVSADGTIFAAHDPQFINDTSQKTHFCNASDLQISAPRLPNGHPKFVELEEALLLFKKNSAQEQTICIDIKDVGFENEHLALVRKHGLESRTVFISWAPQVIENLWALGTEAPLILSHWSTRGLGLVGRILSRLLSRTRLSIGHLVLLGASHARKDLGKYKLGYQHGLVSYDLDEELLSMLQRSGGGICVHKSVATSSLRRYCEQQSLKLAVFSAHHSQDFMKWASFPNIAIVFSDDACGVLRSLGWDKG